MANFTRYDCENGKAPAWQSYGPAEMVPDENGEWVKFDDIKELLNTSTNNRYVTAFDVYEEFLRSAEYTNGEGFRPWLKAHLSLSKQTLKI